MKNALSSLFKALIAISILVSSSSALSVENQNENQIDNQVENIVTLRNLKDSSALTEVRDFMTSVRADLESYYIISDRNLKLPARHVCVYKTKAEVLRTVTKSIMHTLKLYPDEELPVEEAVNDLRSFLRAETYEVCTFSRVVKEEKIEHTLFYSQSGTFYLRLDFISPVN